MNALRISLLFLLLWHLPRAFASTGIETAYTSQPTQAPPVAWLTGPLLTTSARVIPPGHLNFEPYVFVSKISHVYDKEWRRRHVSTFVSVLSQYQFKIGVIKDFDVQIFPSFEWNHSHGQARWVFNDFPVTIEYQLLGSKEAKWYPLIKLSLTEVFPTGKYQHLSAKKNGTDAGGEGSFQSQLGITFSKLFYFGNDHWLDCRLNVNYIYLAPVHVKGLNVYGGAKDTDGKAYPGNQFSQFLGFQFTLTQRWALALDIVNLYGNKTRFTGKNGTAATGSSFLVIEPATGQGFIGLFPPIPQAATGRSSFNQISLAPAIEYNWSANIGVIAGAWFTVAGRNSSDFFQWAAAFNLYH